MPIRRAFPLLLLLVGIPFGGPFATSSESLTLDPQQALAAHNTFRSLLNDGRYPGQPVPNPALPRMSWDQDLDHVARYDVQTSRLFLPHVAVVNGTVTSQHSAVLEVLAGEGINLRLLSID